MEGPTNITVAADPIESTTDLIRVFLNIMPGIDGAAIVVKKNGIALIEDIDFTLSTFVGDPCRFDITFSGAAALDNSSVITVEITKDYYLYNDGNPVEVDNNIPI